MKTSIYDREQNIYELQTALRAMWQDDKILTIINPDGVFGSETTIAVKEAQLFFGLPQTGDADYDTWELIFESYFDGL